MFPVDLACAVKRFAQSIALLFYHTQGYCDTGMYVKETALGFYVQQYIVRVYVVINSSF